MDLSSWPALVLTAGLATRLRPLSLVRAKAAMPVAGTPLVVRILRGLHDAGVRRVVVNLHHRPETITAVIGDGSHLGLQVRYSWEPVVLGSAGGPRHALPLLDAERFLVVNGDTLTNCDLRGVAAHHVRSGARVTMAVVPGDVERYGGVLIGADGYVSGFGRPREGTRALHFIGIQAIERDVFQNLPDNEPLESVKTVYPQLIATQRNAIVPFETSAEFLDVGTSRDYLSTVEVIAAREGRALDVGEHCAIAPSARLERTIVWDRVTIEDDAELAGCIVADDVVVPARSRYANSVLVQTAAGVVATPL